MRQRFSIRLLLLALGALLGSGIRAQSDIVGEVLSENGLHRAKFQVPQGVIRVNLPDDVSAGDSISGTVYTEPSGKNPKELTTNTGEITGYVVEMPGQKAKTSDRHFHWGVPVTVAGGVIPILLRDRKNKIVGHCNLPINSNPGEPPPTEIDLPLGAEAGSMTSVWGPFGGASGASVSVGGKDADVIAESPRKLVFVTPTDVVGRSTLQVRSGTLSASAPFFTLGLQLGATKTSLMSGETAIMSATVTGLQDLRQPATLIIVNHEPGTVALAGGPAQEITIQPAEVRPDGTFAITRVLTGVKGGAYLISVAATRPPSAQVPIDRLVGRTVDGWSMAQNVPISAEARSLIVSDVVAARPQLDRLLLSQVAFRADIGTELDWLVRDYCFNLRDLKLGGRLAESFPPRHRRVANSFVPQGGAQPGRAVSLDASDVRRFSFTQFLAQLLARLTPSDPLGNLVVTSRPDRQAIAVDQVTGADYLTTRSFVLSVGKHTIRVASCNQSVTVNANQQATVSCPP
ncbi:MAG TPA: hypothetical protein VG096_10240 [Bryobacteraceae bacterium]|jgi:hypothetical protein|nr:hypothetical protein [Bryobacteraceae bacterium]